MENLYFECDFPNFADLANACKAKKDFEHAEKISINKIFSLMLFLSCTEFLSSVRLKVSLDELVFTLLGLK